MCPSDPYMSGAYDAWKTKAPEYDDELPTAFECESCGEKVYEGEESLNFSAVFDDQKDCTLCRIKYIFDDATDHELAALQYYMENKIKKEKVS